MKRNKKLSAKIALKEIKIQNFSIQKRRPRSFKFSTSNIGFRIGIGHKLSLRSNQFFVKIDIDLMFRKSVKDSKPSKIGNFCCEYIFKVINLKNLIKKDEKKKISIPKELVETFDNLSISTSRGILHCKLTDTYLQKAMLPIIRASSLSPDEKNN